MPTQRRKQIRAAYDLATTDGAEAARQLTAALGGAPIDPRAERRDAAAFAAGNANHLIRLATELEEISARKLNPALKFNTLVMVFSPSSDGIELRTQALAFTLPEGVQLRMPNDPTQIQWIAEGRYVPLMLSDGVIELVGLQPGVSAEAFWR